jgi:hypothetical protein
MDLTARSARKWRISSPEVASSESRPAVEAEGHTQRAHEACMCWPGSNKTPTKFLLAGMHHPPPFY